MRFWVKGVLGLAGAIAGSTAVSVALGNLLWRRSTDRAIDRLHAVSLAPGEALFSLKSLEGLPEPVVRYFQYALTPGQQMIRRARIEHTGEFRSGGLYAPWKPFRSVQHYTTNPPGFVWDATIRMAPFLTVRVRDAYQGTRAATGPRRGGGAGSMQAKLASTLSVMDQSGKPELNAGSLHRYLAETVWFPTALLPVAGVTWAAIDGATARATLADHGTTISLGFQFGEDGAIVRASAPDRPREVKGEYVPTPWVVSYTGYEWVGGMRVPMEGEVAWILPEGRLSYWRGRIVATEYGS
jgi:hypothetical protein